MNRLARYAVNTLGRDIAVGDIHGNFSKLIAALEKIGFNPDVDRLFATGDLVDKGFESHLAIKWLNFTWFRSVRGNHDDHVVRYEEKSKWLSNFGKWFNKIAPHLQEVWAYVFNRLPYVIEVETAHGVVGIVHADVQGDDWGKFTDKLKVWNMNQVDRKSFLQKCMYNRKRYEEGDNHTIKGVRAVVIGHIPVKEMEVHGNMYYIDTTGGEADKPFTLLDLNTLQVIEGSGNDSTK